MKTEVAMSLLEEQMAEIGREYARKINGLREQAGKLAELESLAAAISEHMDEHTDPVCCVTAHHDGDIYARLLVFRHFEAFRAALSAAGLVIESEIDVELYEGVRRIVHMHLVGFETLVEIHNEPLPLKVAA